MPVAADTAGRTADLSQGLGPTVAAEKARGQRGGVTTPRTTSIRDDLAAAGLLPTSGQSRRTSDPVEAEFLNAGGWQVASIKGGDEDGGITSHRGVLHPHEYVDDELLQLMVERRLGFTYEQIRSVYRQGPLTEGQRELRGKIDARLLALSRAGGNMTELGNALGFKTTGDTLHRAIKNALARARGEESASTPSSSPEDSRHPRTPSGSLDGDRRNESMPGTSSTTATSTGGMQ